MILFIEPFHWPELLHELAHCLLQEKSPDRYSEFRSIGWELMLADHLRLDIDEFWKFWGWQCVDRGRDIRSWDSLSLQEFTELLEAEREFERRRGSLRPGGPVPLRSSLTANAPPL
jgi:hypothetical protein